MNYFFSMGAWAWVILGVALLVIEVLGGGGFLLCVGLSALAIALISSFVDISWQVQLIVFAFLSVISTFFYWKYYKPTDIQSEDPMLNNRMERLVGTKTALIQPIVAGVGKVQISDALWTVHCEEELEQGNMVEVVGYDESTLIVKPI